MKNCLVVLGMHRSGTSALTGVLERVGVDLGNELMTPAADNPSGFFENTLVVDTNEAILAASGSAWDSPFALANNWQDKLTDNTLAQAASAFIQSNITSEHVYALKDPRLSRLLPWWQSLFVKAGVTGRYVILVRHPLEIADSLAARNGLSQTHSLLLWMHYMLEAERYTRGQPRAFVHYHDLLDDPVATVQGVFSRCGLPAPDNLQAAAADFIKNDMRHHSADNEALQTRCPALTAELYSALSRLARSGQENESDAEKLDNLAAAFTEAQALYYSPEIMAAVADRRLLPDDLRSFLSSPPWRIYRAYQHAVYRWLPEGTPLRTFLQRAKKALLPSSRD